MIVLTDGETYAGRVHPAEALRAYRRKMGIQAKAVMVSFAATRFSIVDPEDAGTLDLVGTDASTPTLLHDFIEG